jgi:hypothetical protein
VTADYWRAVIQSRTAAATNSGPLQRLRNRKGFNSTGSKGAIAPAALAPAAAIA